MHRELPERGDLTHVLSNVQVGLFCYRTTSSAGSTLDAFEEFVFLGKLLSIHFFPSLFSGMGA
jgi:hypothetical protein